VWILRRIANILLFPRSEWEVIKHEDPSAHWQHWWYLLSLFLLPVLGTLTGEMLFRQEDGAVVQFGLARGLTWSLTLAVAVIAGSYVVDWVGSLFGSRRNLGRSRQLLIYATTPAWVTSLLLILPILRGLGTVFAVYSAYLFFLGAPALRGIPREKQFWYTAVAGAVFLLLYLALAGVIATGLLDLFGLGSTAKLGGK